MNIFKRIVTAITNKTAFEQYIDGFYAGDDVSWVKSPQTSGYLKYSAVFACLRVLAETFASVSLHEYRKVDDKNREKTDKTGLLDLLTVKPNSYMDSYSFNIMSMNQLNTDGNFFCFKDRYAGSIVGLRPINYQDIAVKQKEDGSIIYEVNLNNKTEEFTREDIWHTVGFTVDGLLGLSPMEYFGAIARLGNSYNNFSQNFYDNGLHPSGVFQMDRKLAPEEKQEFDKYVEERWAGQRNTGKYMTLSGGTKFLPIAIKPADAQLIESKKFNVSDMARIYRVPLHLLQDLDRATNNNIEHQSLEFVMYTMLPWFKQRESSINTWLLTPQQRRKGYYYEYNIASLLRGDAESMATAFATGRQWGWLSVNDIRRMLNLNPIENGDRYLEPMNMTEAGQERVNNKLKKDILNLIEDSK